MLLSDVCPDKSTRLQAPKGRVPQICQPAKYVQLNSTDDFIIINLGFSTKQSKNILNGFKLKEIWYFVDPNFHRRLGPFCTTLVLNSLKISEEYFNHDVKSGNHFMKKRFFIFLPNSSSITNGEMHDNGLNALPETVHMI